MVKQEKYRIIQHFYKDSDKELKSTFYIEEYKEVGFFRKEFKWMPLLRRWSYGEYSSTEVIEYETEKDARNYIKKLLVVIPEDKIIQYHGK